MKKHLATIAENYLTEIEAAEPGARGAIINEFDYLLTALGKLNTLTKVESAAGDLVDKVESEMGSAVAAAEKLL